MTKRLLSLALAVMMVLSLCTFCVFAEIEVPEEIETAAGADGVDDGTIVTLFDDPVTTTWGVTAKVLPEEGYTFKTDGQLGLTFIFKFEGTKPDTVFGKLFPNITTNRVTKNDALDENGDPIKNIWHIDDEATFKAVSDLYEAALLENGYYTRQSAILDELNAATDALIEWGLNLFGKVYPKEAQLLRNEAKRSYTQRKKIADYAFSLDASTTGGIA